MTVYDGFSLMGGLALFLFGMKLLGDSLEQRAGTRLKPILESLTNKPIKGVIVGALVTAVIQSSSATTVMLVGFVNSGIMQLSQAISVIMGANIGTTATAWILSLSGIESSNFWVSLFKPTTFSPILAFVGIIILFTSKRKKDIASIFLGFAILMFGMDMMSGSVKGLANIPEFANILLLFSNPIFGVLAGAVITGIIQSSSASVGLLQALSLSGGVTYGIAIPIIMGQNIGTCVTALLASIGTNKNAKRVAIAHLFFNLIGTVVFLALFSVANVLFPFSFVDQQISPLGVAVVHSLFNLLATLMLFPFAKQLERLSRFMVKDGGANDQLEFLDERLLATPSFAIAQCRKLTGEMAVISRDAFFKSIDMLNSYNEKEGQIVVDAEDKVDLYEDKLGSYLVKVSTKTLSQADSQEASKLLHMIGDFERISDHAVNVIEAAQEMSDKGVSFSEEAQYEVSVISNAVIEILTKAVASFVNNDLHLASQVEPLEQVVDTLRTEVKDRHIQRLTAGTCTIELGFILSDLLTNFERVADHCSNIAVSVIEMEQHGSLDTHEYLRNVKSGKIGSSFSDMYEGYLKKYDLKA